MSPLAWGAAILGGLFLVALGFVVITYLSFLRGNWQQQEVTVDGKTFLIRVRYGSKLPREKLKVQGFAMDGRVWMANLVEAVHRVDMAHEVLHLVREYVVGRFRYKVEAIAEWLVQREWKRRGTEQEPRRGQAGLAVDGWEDVVIAGKVRRVSALWLLNIPTM
jgi:hypothetical protein